MISLPVHDQQGKEVGTYEFPAEDLASGINKQLLHDVVVMYEANKRQGTVQTKSRGMVNGSTAKLYRQKGTGRARAGASRNPVRRGGGHAFGKKPKDWSYRLPKKAVQAATRMALLSKFQDNEVCIVDSISVGDTPKTRTVVDAFKALGLDSSKTLMAVESHDPIVWRSARNIEGLRVSPASDLNAYDLLRQKMLLITKEAIDQIRGLGETKED